MSDKQLLDYYASFMPFLAKVLGPNCEIVLHDVVHPKKSIVAIYNTASGRQIGDPMTDLALNIMEEGIYKNVDYITNYEGKSVGKNYISSTYFIKNNNDIIGMLCINKDVTNINAMKNSIQALLDGFNLNQDEGSAYSENLDTDIASIMDRRIENEIRENGISPDRMTQEEKIALLHKLNSDGLLSVKGSKNKVAELLHISIPTIYRYLNK